MRMFRVLGALLLLATPLAAQGTNPVNSRSLTAVAASCTASSTGCLIVGTTGSGGLGVDIRGTFTATVQFEGLVSSDTTKTWVAVNCTPYNSTTAVTSTAAAGSWGCAVGGLSFFRVRVSAYTSGTIDAVTRTAATLARGTGSGGGFSVPSGWSWDASSLTGIGQFDIGVGRANIPAFIVDNYSWETLITNNATSGNVSALSIEASSRMGLASTVYNNSQTGALYGVYTDTYSVHDGQYLYAMAGDAIVLAGSTDAYVVGIQAYSSVGAGLSASDVRAFEAFPNVDEAATVPNVYGIYIYNTHGGTNNRAIYIENMTGGHTIDQAINYADKFVVDSTGEIASVPLKTTGSAGGKKVVCVDTATGKLYASSTGTDCSN